MEFAVIKSSGMPFQIHLVWVARRIRHRTKEEAVKSGPARRQAARNKETKGAVTDKKSAGAVHRDSLAVRHPAPKVWGGSGEQKLSAGLATRMQALLDDHSCRVRANPFFL